MADGGTRYDVVVNERGELFLAAVGEDFPEALELRGSVLAEVGPDGARRRLGAVPERSARLLSALDRVPVVLAAPSGTDGRVVPLLVLPGDA